MFNLRRLSLAAFAFALAGFVFTGPRAGAGDDKKPDSKFTGKTISLKLTDGKASHPAEFGDDDPKYLGRFRYKVFTVQLEMGKVYRIDHKGTGGDARFDPYLMLEDESGKQVAFDDDSAGGLDARIVHRAAKSGTYRIVATTFVANQTGKFTLAISPPSKNEAQSAELLFRAEGFVDLTPPQRKDLVQEVNKHLVNLDGELTFLDFRLASQVAIEAELDGNIELARDSLKESVKHFSAAKSESVTKLSAQLESALANLDRLGKVIEISGKTLDGKDFDLKNLKGKIVLVDFWGTWCGPCVQEMPNVLKAYNAYHKKGFEVIGVARDKNDEIVSKFMNARKLPWACINIEDSKKLIEAHGVRSYPTVMLVDETGRLVSMRARGPQLERLLARLLPEKK